MSLSIPPPLLRITGTRRTTTPREYMRPPSSKLRPFLRSGLFGLMALVDTSPSPLTAYSSLPFSLPPSQREGST